MKTEDSIVLTIFEGERSVTTLQDLETVARAIYQKTVREAETSANPSTLGAEIEGQISLLNAESGPSETKAPKP